MTSPVRIIIGDVRDGLRSLAAGSVQCCVTSPPYWGLRDYGVDGQIGLESTPEAFVAKMVEVFREVRRVLRDDGTLWLNIGDSYSGNATSGGAGKQDTNCRIANVPTKLGKPKDLCMIPWRVALALQADGWWIRSVIVWAKKSPMPESVTDRPTSSWEPIFLLAKSERYFYDAEAVKEALNADTVSKIRQCMATPPDKTQYKQNAAVAHIGGGSTVSPNAAWRDAEKLERMLSGRNQRNVWHLGPEPYAEAHFATFPTEIPRRAIRAGTSEKGCCPACGAPWERVVERTAYTPKTVPVGVRNVDSSRGDKVRKLSGKEYNEQASARTVGWEPGCACPPAEPVPCVVLDPFLGSGTTIAAARQLGRHGVGCELNPAYADMARVRIAKAEKPHTFVDHREPAEKGLFA